jgi:ATP-dependent DNA ligase
MQNHQGVFRLMEIPLLGRRFPPQKMGLSAYLHRMFKAFEFCLPTKSTIVPGGPDWFHEIKYDGYLLRVERNGDRVRLITFIVGQP